MKNALFLALAVSLASVSLAGPSVAGVSVPTFPTLQYPADSNDSAGGKTKQVAPKPQITKTR